MYVIIDIDGIGEVEKKEWLLSSLRFMNIDYRTSESRQTIEEYNADIDEVETAIDKGEFITAEALKIEAQKW